MISHVALRLGFWLLLTADTSWTNIAIGVLLAFALPRHKDPRQPLSGWIKGAWQLLKLVPIAYRDAVSLLLHAHPEEAETTRTVDGDYSSWSTLLHILLINFSPKTLVTWGDEQQRLHIHHIRRRDRA